MRIPASLKHDAHQRMVFKQNSHGKIYQFPLMKKDVHRGAHALTCLMFVLWVNVFSITEQHRLGSEFLQIFVNICISPPYP